MRTRPDGAVADQRRPHDSEIGIVQRDVAVSAHTFTVVSIDLSHADLQLYWKQPGGSRFGTFDALANNLRADGKQLLFAANAGIFNPDFTPCGLHVEKGLEHVQLNLGNGDGNFYMKPNGIFLIDAAGAHIIDSTTYRGTTPDVRLATQSGPLLVINGMINSAFKAHSTNRYIRSGVGVSSTHRVRFAISLEPVTFFEFASLFRDKLGCPNALYLDGVISRFYLPPSETGTGGGEFAGILGATAHE